MKVNYQEVEAFADRFVKERERAKKEGFIEGLKTGLGLMRIFIAHAENDLDSTEINMKYCPEIYQKEYEDYVKEVLTSMKDLH